jgi:hypothetical protein
VARAFEQARTEVALVSAEQAALLRLCVRAGADAGSVVLVPPPEREVDLESVAAAAAFLARPPSAVLYHAPWSKRSIEQIDTLRAVLCDLGGRLRAGKLDVTDEMVDELWEQKIRVFPTLLVSAGSGPPRRFTGAATSADLVEAIRPMLKGEAR